MWTKDYDLPGCPKRRPRFSRQSPGDYISPYIPMRRQKQYEFAFFRARKNRLEVRGAREGPVRNCGGSRNLQSAISARNRGTRRTPLWGQTAGRTSGYGPAGRVGEYEGRGVHPRGGAAETGPGPCCRRARRPGAGAAIPAPYRRGAKPHARLPGARLPGAKPVGDRREGGSPRRLLLKRIQR